MLKRKHEEAKELLVRAIVNNNALLMLNHPLFEEKISFHIFDFFPFFLFNWKLVYLHCRYIRALQRFAKSLQSDCLSTEKRWYPITTYMIQQLICCNLFVPFMLELKLWMKNYDGELLREKVLLQLNFLWSCEWNCRLKLDSCDKWKIFL